MLSVSLSPCCRSHPARVVRRVSQSATAHAAFTFPVAGSASGAAHFRGHRCVRLRYSLETRPHPEDEAVERLQRVGFPSPCAPSYRALTFPLVGLPPTEHASLRWTHNRTCHFHGIRLCTFRSVFVFALWHDVHTGWRCFMRSASVESLNRFRGVIWSISTSLACSVVPHM